MAQLISEAKRFQKLAGLITEAEAPTPSTSTITAKIDQNLDKIESLPIVQQTAEKIMNDPKLMQQFQQGLSKMGIGADLMKENEDVSSDTLSKIISAAANKEKQLQEKRFITPDEIDQNPDKYSHSRDPLAVAGEKQREAEASSIDDRGGAILRGLFGMPVLVGALDYFANTGIINTISKGIGTNLGLLATMAVGALVGGIVGAIAHKKRQQQKESLLNENKDLNSYGKVLFDRLGKNGFSAKFVKTANEFDKLSQEVRNSKNKLAVVQYDDMGTPGDGFILVGGNNNTHEEIGKILDSIKSELPEGGSHFSNNNWSWQITGPGMATKKQESLDIESTVNEALTKFRKNGK